LGTNHPGNTVTELNTESVLYTVYWDDQQGLCAPMTWDDECQGAICAGPGKIAAFVSRRDARKAINISTKWNTLLKAQGKPYNTDFEGVCRQYIRVAACTFRPPKP